MRRTDPARLPAWRVLLIFVIALVLIVTLIYQLGAPLRHIFANRFLERGDTFFSSLEYDSAEREYDKALLYDKNMTLAADHLALVKEAPTDIAVARDFFAEKGRREVVDRIDAAKEHFTDPKKALETGATLYQQGQYVYAQYPLQTAVTLDPEYPEAWHYLALTYDHLAKENARFREKAVEARAKRDALTPRYLNQ